MSMRSVSISDPNLNNGKRIWDYDEHFFSFARPRASIKTRNNRGGDVRGKERALRDE